MQPIPLLLSASRCWILAPLLMWGAALSGQENQDIIDGEPDEYDSQIFLCEPDGSKLRMLMKFTDYSFQGSPEWSRDGKVIAFDCAKRGESGTAAVRIGIANGDGTNPRIAGEGAMPSLSPKGNRIAYSRYGEGVWMQKITNPPQPPTLLDAAGWGTAWSPDGTRIAYATFSPPNLVVHDLVEGTRVNLFSAKNPLYRQIQWNFGWSPDSKQLAFRGITADGKHVLSIVDGRGAEFGHRVRWEQDMLPTISWSADGKQVLFAALCAERMNLPQLYALDPLTNDPPKLLPGQAANRWLQDMSAAPDGSKLAVLGRRPPKK